MTYKGALSRSGRMNSASFYENAAAVKVANISANGLWLLVGDREYFLSYEKYPWFKDVRISEILDVQLLHGFHLHWPNLDVDLEVASLENPDTYPLMYTGK